MLIDQLKKCQEFINARIELLEGENQGNSNFESNLTAIKNGCNRMVGMIEEYQEEQGFDDEVDENEEIEELDAKQLGFGEGDLEENDF
ncbi:MAG: hypothetical protein QM538_05200 [Methylacidiphilales bacterium]|nr:hypothetical protein [Candidatus Methylacidiphilales bacterium]